MQKKFFTLVLAMFMMLAMTTPVFASFSTEQEYVSLHEQRPEIVFDLPEEIFSVPEDTGSRGFINLVIRIIKRL